MIVRCNILIPFLKTGQKFLPVIIEGCLATKQNGLICHIWYNKTITMATRLFILTYCYGITWTTYWCIYIRIYWNFFQYQSVFKIIILYFKKSKQWINSKFQNFLSSIWMHNINFSLMFYLKRYAYLNVYSIVWSTYITCSHLNSHIWLSNRFN